MNLPHLLYSSPVLRPSGDTVARTSADSGGERRCQQHQHRRVLGIGVLVLGAVSIFVAPAAAQMPSEPTGRLQVAAGMGWLGGAAFGEQPADLRAGSGGAYRLFDSETD